MYTFTGFCISYLAFYHEKKKRRDGAEERSVKSADAVWVREEAVDEGENFDGSYVIFMCVGGFEVVGERQHKTLLCCSRGGSCGWDLGLDLQAH